MLARTITALRAADPIPGTQGHTPVRAAQDTVEVFIDGLIDCLDGLEPLLRSALADGRDAAAEALDEQASCVGETQARANEAHDELSAARQGFEAELRDIRMESTRLEATVLGAEREIARLEAEEDRLRRDIERAKLLLLLGAIGVLILQGQLRETMMLLETVRAERDQAQSALTEARQRIAELDRQSALLRQEVDFVLSGSNQLAVLRNNIDQLEGVLVEPEQSEIERVLLNAALRQIDDLRLLAGR